MAMVIEPNTRKREHSVLSQRSSFYTSAPFGSLTSFGLANGYDEVTPPFEKKLRTMQKPMPSFKWEPDGTGNMQREAGYGSRNAQVKTSFPAALQDRSSRGLSTPSYVRRSREKYEVVKEEMKQRSLWHSKLDYSSTLADDALDSVGGPVVGLNLILKPTGSYRPKYIDANRELQDYKRVLKVMNNLVPLSSNGTHAGFSSLESMKLRGSNLQQGPRNLYSMQETSAKESQRGGGHSDNGLQNGGRFFRTAYDEEAQPSKDLLATDAATTSGPESSVWPAAMSVVLHDYDEAQVPKTDDQGKIAWKILKENAQDPAREARLESNVKDIEYVTQQLTRIKLHGKEDEVRRQKEREASKKKEVIEALIPLSDEAEEIVYDALRSGNRNDVLAFHEETNIEVTRAVIQCLVPSAWLNDEVINVYMQLLKERENQSPDKFLKCHFFNSFFYNKLFKDKRNYDYKSVRRWTTQRKIGYSLADCDKILVPIHQDIHWCLAVINLRDQKFEYLDSLKGRDENVLKVLAKYLVDEAKDKDSRILDVSKWESVFPKDIPEQFNGCDCGMFMLKYADFHSRGGSLSFTQEHMEYFRRRTVYEILQSKAT